MLIDSHCHLDPKYQPDCGEQVLARARDAGVGGFLCVGVGDSLAPMAHAVALAEQHTDVLAAIAVHPHEASHCTEELVDRISGLAVSTQVVAIGEIGLDYHYDFSPRDQQREVLRRFIALAREVHKPVVIHTREADDDTLAILKEERASEVGGVLHCFSGGPQLARAALDLGFDLSFSGIVTFPSATEVHEVARFVPADRYLVETDSPYLAPVPMRGKKCEPAFVVHTARRLAELRGVAEEQVAEETTANFVRRFRPPQSFMAVVRRG